MDLVHQLKVGDKIVDFKQVYIIFKIKREHGFSGKRERCIFYKPYFKENSKQSLTCSIPESNMHEANLRKPSSSKKISRAIKLLGIKPSEEAMFNLVTATQSFKENNPLKSASIVRSLWVEKHDSNRSFSIRKSALYKDAMMQFIEEVSVVKNINLESAKKKIIMRLRKNYTKKEEKEN